MSRPNNLTLKGPEIESLEVATGHDDGVAELLDFLWLEHSYAHPGKTECTKCRRESELRIKLPKEIA